MLTLTLKTWQYLFILLSMMATGYAEWNPENCLNIKNPSLHALQDPNYIQLKDKVFAFIKNSWCSREKANLMMDLILLTKPQNCVEIGVFNGSSALPILATLKYLKHGQLYAVDAWSNEEAVKYMPHSDGHYAWWLKVKKKKKKMDFLTMINRWSLANYCKTIHATSEAAANQLENIDFLHLDGNFSEQGSLLDVDYYLPKVKSGGYILLSNFFAAVNGKYTKMPTMWALMDACDVVCEIDNNSVALFRKQ